MPTSQPRASATRALAALRSVAPKLVFAAGDWTVRKDVWLAQVARTLAHEIGAECITLPGSHVSYKDHAVQWAAEIAAILR